jgi:hypothetical protein
MAKEGKTNGDGFLDFCGAQEIEACKESHPRRTNLELELVYMIRAPGAGDKFAPNSSLDRIYTLLHTDCPRISRLSHCASCLSNKADNPPWITKNSSVTWLFRDSLLRWGRLGRALHLRKPISHQYKGAQDPAQHYGKFRKCHFLASTLIALRSCQTSNLTTSGIEVQKCITFPAPR